MTTSSSRFAPARDAAAFVITVATIAGFVAYMVLRYVYSRFLGSFALRPEDLGLDYFELLTGSLSTLLFGIGFSSAASLLALIYFLRVTVAWWVLAAYPISSSMFLQLNSSGLTHPVTNRTCLLVRCSSANTRAQYSSGTCFVRRRSVFPAGPLPLDCLLKRRTKI